MVREGSSTEGTFQYGEESAIHVKIQRPGYAFQEDQCPGPKDETSLVWARKGKKREEDGGSWAPGGAGENGP